MARLARPPGGPPSERVLLELADADLDALLALGRLEHALQPRDAESPREGYLEHHRVEVLAAVAVLARMGLLADQARVEVGDVDLALGQRGGHGVHDPGMVDAVDGDD